MTYSRIASRHRWFFWYRCPWRAEIDGTGPPNGIPTTAAQHLSPQKLSRDRGQNLERITCVIWIYTLTGWSLAGRPAICGERGASAHFPAVPDESQDTPCSRHCGTANHWTVLSAASLSCLRWPPIVFGLGWEAAHLFPGDQRWSEATQFTIPLLIPQRVYRLRPVGCQAYQLYFVL